MTKMEIKEIARVALESEYGFAPLKKNIILLEDSDDGTYIRFKVRGHEYKFSSYQTRHGIWAGSGTIEKIN